VSAPERSHIQWRKSSWCSASDCVEVAVAADLDTGANSNEAGGKVFLVRDSKNPTQNLRFTSAAWETFILDIKGSSGLGVGPSSR
jgi:hypothetical protein